MTLDDFHIGDTVRDIKPTILLNLKPNVQTHTKTPLCKVVGIDYAWGTVKLLPLNPALAQYLSIIRYGKRLDSGVWVYARSPQNLEMVERSD